MEKERYLKTDFRRLLKISSVSGDSRCSSLFHFSLENYAFEKGMVNFNVMDTYIYAVEMSGKMIAYAFCASAFAAVFCEDLENKYLRYSIGRGNLKNMCFQK